MAIISFEDAEEVIKGRELIIYSHYANTNFTLNTAYKCPFRVDKHPSFNLFQDLNGSDKILWCDQSTGAVGNVFQFVARMFNISVRAALLKINKDFKLRLGEDKPSNFLFPKLVAKKEAKTFEFLKGVFDKEDKVFWECLGLTEKFLARAGVYKASRITINNHMFYSVKGNPIYVYVNRSNNEITFQIYRPFDPQYKWSSTMKDVNIHLLEFLPPKGNNLIITKSRKDALVLNSLNVYAIAPPRENCFIPHSIIYNLQQRFTNIYVLFDPDKTGYTMAEKYVTRYNFKPLYTIEDYCLIKDKHLFTKDISDYRRIKGKEATVDLLKKWLSNGK
jgi:hypothetical protein